MILVNAKIRRILGAAFFAAMTTSPAGAAERVTVLDFVDYGCLACRAASASAEIAEATDRSIIVKRRDAPFTGPDATLAAILLISLEKKSVNSDTARQALLRQGTEALDTVLVASGGILGRDEMETAYEQLSKNQKMYEATGLKDEAGLALVLNGRMIVLKGNIRPNDIMQAAAKLRARAATSSAE